MTTPSKGHFNSKSKGNIGETAFIYQFTKRGIQVSLPIGDNARYDMIIDYNNKLYKIQIKYCSQKTENNSIVIPCSSSLNHTTNKIRRTYENEVDFLGCYLAELDVCCLIPMSVIKNKKSIILRNDSTVYSKSYHLVSDFLLDNVLCVETLHDDSKPKTA